MVDKKKEEEVNSGQTQVAEGKEQGAEGKAASKQSEEANPLPAKADLPLKGEETAEGEEKPAESEKSAGPNVLERLAGIIKKFYPDAEIDTTLELPEPVVALFEQLLPPVEGIVQFHDDFDKVVEEYPEFGEFIIALRNGYAPYEAFVEYLEPEEPGEGAPDFEGSKAARERRSEMTKKRKEREAGVQKNIEGTLANLDQYIADNEKTPEEGQALREHITNLFVDMADGTISLDNIAKIDKGHTFDTVLKQKDTEIDQAFEDGQVSERNKKIQQKRVTKDTGDGLPRMTGAGETGKKKKDGFTSELEQMGNRKPVL